MIIAVVAVVAVIAVVPIFVACIVPVKPGLPNLCVLKRRLLTLEGLQLLCIAALLGNALRGAVVALLATFELVTAFLVAFGIGIVRVQLAFGLAALPLFHALAAIFAWRQYFDDALFAGLCLLLAVGVIAGLLPSQFTRKLPLGLLAHFLPGLFALLGLLCWLLGLLLRLPFALLLAQFLARAAVSFVVGGILRAGESV